MTRKQAMQAFEAFCAAHPELCRSKSEQEAIRSDVERVISAHINAAK